MNCTWLYTGADGQSHLADLRIPAGAPGGAGADPIPALSIWFTETAGGRVAGFHRPARRQFVIVLSGIEEIELADGTTRQFRAGDVLLADDTTGTGHITRDLEDCSRLFIAVPEDFDPNAWVAP